MPRVASSRLDSMATLDYDIFESDTPRDFEQVRTLFLEYAEALGWDLASGGRFADEIENLPGPYAQPSGALLLACVDGEPAGVLGLQPVPSGVRTEDIGAERFGELKRLFVRSRYRRQGIGHALMKCSEVAARERGYETLVLTTSAEMMPLAQRLYDDLGYCPIEPYRTDMNWPGVRWLGLNL